MKDTTHLKSAQAFRAHLSTLRFPSAGWIHASDVWSRWVNSPRKVSWKCFVQGVAA